MTNAQLRQWRRYHAERLEAALAGPFGDVVREVMDFLNTMTPGSMQALLDLIRSRDWHAVDAETRLVVLHEINTAIVRVREAHGAPPFNDPIPPEQPSGFQIIKGLLIPRQTSPAKPEPDWTRTYELYRNRRKT